MPARGYEETVQPFDSFESWQGWEKDHPETRDLEWMRSIAEYAAAHGAYSKFFGRHFTAAEVEVGGENYREELLVGGFNPRQRVLLELLAEWPPAARAETAELRIYAPEALTTFALALRGRYPRFLGSEYTTSREKEKWLFPITVEDLQQLSFPAESFDCVITGEVLEHIPNLRRGLAELCRILRPGGSLLSTFPFEFREPLTQVRATLDESTGIVTHLVEPEYHRDYIDLSGVLVYQVPAWDVVPLCREAGFSQAEMVYFSSVRRAITGGNVAGIFVLRCYR